MWYNLDIMIHRTLSLSKFQSFFLFGPRGTGKTTLVEANFPRQEYFWIDLLDPAQELLYLRDPNALLETWAGATSGQKKHGWIIIDEIQKVPKLLDLVHMAIERFGLKFALTGSNARKLRRGASNLLAGRAVTFNLHPFSSLELGTVFNLHEALNFGMLPRTVALRKHPTERRRFLASYVNTYLREEINAEQLVRKFEPFTRFLSIAAAANGTILNISKLARQANVEPRTAVRYFSLLEDTLLGFFLPSFNRSARKRQVRHPKFYFFDPGVTRAATQTLDIELTPGSYAYGRAFEHFVMLEIIKANDAHEKGYFFSYFKVTSGDGLESEVDLIATKGANTLVIEIKSAIQPDISEIRRLVRLGKHVNHNNCQPYILCRAPRASVREGVRIMPWQQGIVELFS